VDKKKIDINYVPLSEDNLNWFIPLFKKAFNRDISLPDLKKKYDFSDWNKPYLGLFAMHNERPIGFIGICYYRAQYLDKMEWASNFTDSMIHPDYQRFGIYIKLLAKVEELVKENGICFSLGFPNDNSFYPVVNKGMWNYKNRMIGYKFKVNTLPLYKILKKLGAKSVYFKWATNKMKSTACDFQEEAFKEANNKPHIIHDEPFFKYKNSRAHLLLKIDGKFVWIKLGEQLSVGFIAELSESEMLRIVQQIKLIAKKLFINEVIFQFTKNSVQERILSKHYQGFDSWPILFTNQQSQFPIEQLQLQYCDIDSF
jgi:GNAT superfamily N-acetyltransferase